MNLEQEGHSFINALHTFLKDKQIKQDEPMKDHTSFKIGGPADYFLLPETITQVSQIIKVCNNYKIPLFILGNGSNLLVTDKGIRGCVVQLFKNFNAYSIQGTKIKAQAGILLTTIAVRAANASLKGLEFASGIPGTLGGAVYMNAGAYGGEMKQVVTKVTAVDGQGNIRTFSKDEASFVYRHSALQDLDMTVLEVEMELEVGEIDEIKEVMMELNTRRKDKQPLEWPSAGSTFKRPEGYYAGKLIMDADLRGYSVGNAMVSDKHCGFVINKGEASFDDVYRLICHIQDTVKARFGVDLEREVKIVGER